MLPAPHSRTRRAAGPVTDMWWRRLSRATAHLATVALALSVPSAAFADPDPMSHAGTVLAAKQLPEVIAGLQAWLVGILAAVATLFLVLAGVYYATAGG